MARAVGSTSSTDEAGRHDAGRVLLGRVVGAHGLRGELRVRLDGVDPENLLHVATVSLVRDDEEERSQDYRVEGIRGGRGNECRLRLSGLTKRESAESWRGARILARRTELPELEEGSFYAFELVGCEVHLRGGEPIGRIREIWETGGRDVLVIEDAQGRQQLVPAVEPFIQQVDLAARRVEIDAPPGLLDRGDPPESKEQE